MTGLMDREEKLLRLAVDAGATDGEAKAAGERFITMLRSRQYNVDGADTKDQQIADLEKLVDLHVGALALKDEMLAKSTAIIYMADAEIAQLKAAAAPKAVTMWGRLWTWFLWFLVIRFACEILAAGSVAAGH
jgi:hypothetical protein